MKRTWTNRGKKNGNWKDRAWIKESMFRKCDDEIYRSFVRDTQNKVYAVQANAGSKEENRNIYNRCFRINALNKFHFEKSLQMDGKDKVKIAHIQAIYYLMDQLLPLLMELDNIEPYSILSTAMVKNRQFFDMIQARMKK